VLAQLFTAKVAAFAAVGLFTVGTAAAATGNLPGPLQRSVASTVSHAGVALPASTEDSTEESTEESTTTTTETPTSTTVTDDTTTTTTAADGTTTTTATEAASTGAVGPDANGPAKHGLCTAYFAGHAKNPKAVAFRNLVDAATAAGGTVEAFCTPTTTTTATVTTDLAPTDDATATDEASSTKGHGNSGSTPGATAPGRKSSPTGAHRKP
jgi:hypothetical protein